ncbi:hypothetical protein [Streptomyces sp. NPDC006879]|uniref:hypothetical protein n=1 Tax=Streptomyces sp. NPDC006879 TaxID=3364767 RepID=UPI003684E4E5
MRSALLALRVAAAATVLAAAPMVTATDAFAGEEEGRGSVTVTPSKVAPGAQVELRVTGCEGKTGYGKSTVFVSEAHLSGRDGRGNPLYGEAMIRSNAQPGWHTVHVTCDGKGTQATGSVEVVHHGDRPAPHPSPISPIHAGGGGMSSQLAASSPARSGDEGPGLSHAVVGGLLAAAASLAVAGRALRVRRRRSGG